MGDPGSCVFSNLGGFTSIDKINWRINVIISSRDLSRVFEPVVYLDLYTSDGKRHGIEVSVSKFHSLRQDVALILKEIESIKRKGSNILRIMDST